MTTTTNFEEWLSTILPQTDIEFLALYRAVQRGGVFDRYEVTNKDDCKYLKASNCGLILKLASSKAVYIFIQMLAQRARIENFEEWCQVSPKIFKASDATPEMILQEVESYGLAGISGGRLAVRKLKSNIQSIADDKGLEDIRSLCTYNHPYTELAYPYDMNRFTSEDAKRLVIRTYDELNSDAF